MSCSWNLYFAASVTKDTTKGKKGEEALGKMKEKAKQVSHVKREHIISILTKSEQNGIEGQ